MSNQLPERLTIEEAVAQGYTIDATVYPPFAYKGRRFAPDVNAECYTELEAELIAERNKLHSNNSPGGVGMEPTHTQVHKFNWDDAKRLRDVAAACGRGSKQWIDFASIMFDQFNEIYGTAKRLYNDLQSLRNEAVFRLPFSISNDEMAALRRFDECVNDNEGYDVNKTLMVRLAEIGLLRHVSAGYYEHTMLGMAVLEGKFNHDGEPARFERLTADGKWNIVDKDDIPHYESKGQEIRALYAKS